MAFDRNGGIHVTTGATIWVIHHLEDPVYIMCGYRLTCDLAYQQGLCVVGFNSFFFFKDVHN